MFVKLLLKQSKNSIFDYAKNKYTLYLNSM